MPDQNKPATIVGVRAENVYRLRLAQVRVSPTGIIPIAGKNRQGKSSFLRAQIMALWGKTAQKGTNPVHDGADEMSVEIELSDGWKLSYRQDLNGKEEFILRDPEGVRKKDAPREFIKSQLSKLFLDPMELMRADEQKRLLLLEKALPALPADFRRKRESLFSDRTEATREHKRLTALREGAIFHRDAPEEAPDASDLADKIAAKRARNELMARYANVADELRTRKEGIRTQIANLEKLLEVVETDLAILEEISEAWEPIDVSDLESQLREVSTIAQHVEQNRTFAAIAADEDIAKNRVETLTNEIDALDALRKQALDDADLPGGFGFDANDGITLGGRPWAVASNAEQLCASCEFAIHLNPGLKVAYIEDGALIVGEMYDILSERIEKIGGQLWMEIADAHPEDIQGTVIVIEDGTVRGAEPTTVDPPKKSGKTPRDSQP